MPRRQQYGIVVLLSLGYVIIATLVGAYPNNPPNARTGAPGEGYCNCHGNLNTGNGSTAVVSPAEYSPGDTLNMTVTLQDPGQMRWGFEVTVLDSTNSPSGTIIRTDAVRTILSTAGNGRMYLKQSKAGCDSGVVNTAPGWGFKWAAPSAGAGPVTFYVCGVAADGQNDDGGDFSYTSSATVGQTACLAVPGDVNASGTITLGDIVHLLNYVFDRDNPPCMGTDPGNCWDFGLACRGDVNNSASITLGDIVHLLNYVFDRDNPPCMGTDPGNCWTPVASGACCQPVP